MSDKLKPCPFCGHKGILCGNGRSFEVICDNRDCPANDSWSYGEESAIKAWNTRIESTNEKIIAEYELKLAKNHGIFSARNTIARLEKQIADLKAQIPQWLPIDEKTPIATNVLVWLYLPKNPSASGIVIAQKCDVKEDEPEHYGKFRRTIGCWWANGMYYPAEHFSVYMPLPTPPESEA